MTMPLLYGRRKTSKLRVTGLCEGNPPVTGLKPSQRDSAAENISIWWHYHEQEGCYIIGSHLKTYHYHPECNFLITFFVYQKGYKLYPNLAVILSCSIKISNRIGNWNQLCEQTIFVGYEFTKAASITNVLFPNTPRLMLYHCITEHIWIQLSSVSLD